MSENDRRKHLNYSHNVVVGNQKALQGEIGPYHHPKKSNTPGTPKPQREHQDDAGPHASAQHHSRGRSGPAQDLDLEELPPPSSRSSSRSTSTGADSKPHESAASAESSSQSTSAKAHSKSHESAAPAGSSGKAHGNQPHPGPTKQQTFTDNYAKNNASSVNGDQGDVPKNQPIQKWDQNSAADNSSNVNGNMDTVNFMAFMR